MTLRVKRALKIISLFLLTVFVIMAVLAYLRQREVKRAFIAKISDEATSFIGQKVEIGDLSGGTGSGIDIYDIAVKNPEGFISGDLLRIKRVHLKMRYGDLASRKFSFENITVFSPELSLSRDKEGRMNISEKLIEFFKKESKGHYQADDVVLKSGTIGFNEDALFRTTGINMHLKNLSSEPGTQTLITGSASYSGGRIGINGWLYLKDEPKKLELRVTSDGISLAQFGTLLNSYKIQTAKATVAADLEAKGDTGKGLNFTLKVHVRDAGISFVRSAMKNILFSTEGFFNIRENSIQISDLLFSSDDIFSLRAQARISNILENPVIHSGIRLNNADLAAFAFRENFAASGILTSDTIQMQGSLKDMKPEVSGTVFLNKGALQKKDERSLVKDASIRMKFWLKGEDAGFQADATIRKLFTNITGSIRKALRSDRSLDIKITQPEINLTHVRESFWEIFPDSLLYTGLSGSLSSEIRVFYSDDAFSKITGNVRLKDLVLEGENGEYAIGPVTGAIPLFYDQNTKNRKALTLPSFERSEFSKLNTYYSQAPPSDGYSKITIGSLSYGFRFLEDITLWLKQEDTVLNIARFSGNIPGGRFDGAAVLDVSNGLAYRAGFLIKGLSLAELCDRIEPIKGYISGKVDGIANLKGQGIGVLHLIGKADFWTYGTKEEKTKISREFLQRVGGPSVGAYLRDRDFDKGEMSLYLQNGYIIFKELEISNRNLIGIQDLSIKVAPLNNRITIEHLMWSITEAASRAQKKE